MGKDDKSRTISLPRTTYAPSLGDLQYVVQRARDNHGCSVESTWVPLGSTKMYQLSVVSNKGGTKFAWILHEHAGGFVSEVWKSENMQLEEIAAHVGKLSGATKVEHVVRPDGDGAARRATVTREETTVLVDHLLDEDHVHDLAFMGASGDAVFNARNQLLDAGSGAYSYSVLRKFLDYECARFLTLSVPVSLIVFEIATVDEKPLPPSALTTAVLRLQMIKQELDIIGVLDQREIALVLTNTRPDAAAFVANKALDILTTAPLAPGFGKNKVRVFSGVAGLPDHGEDVISLVNAAKSAKDKTKSKENKMESRA